MFPALGVFEHEPPDASSDEQLPNPAAFGSNAEASQEPPWSGSEGLGRLKGTLNGLLYA